jgi:hypothetical protein
MKDAIKHAEKKGLINLIVADSFSESTYRNIQIYQKIFPLILKADPLQLLKGD